ncbi:MAG: peptide chain release factor 2 [Pyrinomonas methylaliphatogenes]|uniref:Peptide chain release factor 2 n=1 Tax=Pyrinomonas methylaliphatogenes TaxID=454194 RepID=A0A0B6WYX4_9BACT|nr:peptide chain release factor 2 [Pyrinomonas methylaliphatogenes]CDM65360.1 bacterial peptide chain release factor 2 (bRF-2) [Pyrinomonas methylaliphatogenes]
MTICATVSRNSGGSFEIDRQREELARIEERAASQDFWSDQEEAQKLLQQRSRLERIISRQEGFERAIEDVHVLLEFAEEDEASLHEALSLIEKLEKEVSQAETEALLSGENDARNAICTIHPGAGGVDAQDWAEMLLRMYLRWAERRGFKTEILDYQPGEEAGLKSATFRVEGPYAYGLLSAEAGVHRLVRISPFDQAARRHTSFASLFVYPEIDEEIEIEINEKDLRIDTFRSTGAGGQHVNKTDSAVRITHLPTGIVVQCQNQRSQHQNRAVAMQILRARLYELELEKRRAETAELEASKADISFGSQIRSYVLAPYRLVKDTRTGYERGDVDAVLDGDLDDFIKAYLLSRRTAKR